MVQRITVCKVNSEKLYGVFSIDKLTKIALKPSNKSAIANVLERKSYDIDRRVSTKLMGTLRL